jgi:hypothetical protein
MTAPAAEPDVIDLLLEQHDQIRACLEGVRDEDHQRRAEAFQDLVRLLAVHESAEEQVVHPMARRYAGDEVIEERLLEEGDAKVLLNEVYEMGLDAPRFDTRFSALETAVLRNLAQEEKHEFPVLRREADPGTLRRMATALRAAEAIAPRRPHPQAGVHPMTNMLAGPPVALFDQAREALGNWRRSHGG